MAGAHILVADDHAIVRRGLRALIQSQPGWEVCAEAANGREAVEKVAELTPDVAIIDIGMPVLNGLEATRHITNASPRTEVLILTMHQSDEVVREVLKAGARGYVLKADADRNLVAAIEMLLLHKPFLTSDVTDHVLSKYLDARITGLDRGADDYMVKPFAFAELSARVRALLRRGVQENTKLIVADLEMDTATRIVRRANQRIDLKLKEYALLEFLMRHMNRPVTRTMITEHIWDIHHDSMSNVVDVHIKSLRDKIDKGFSSPLIHTIRGVGYMLGTEIP